MEGTTSTRVVTDNSGPRPPDLSMQDMTHVLFGHAAFQYLYAGCVLGTFEFLRANPRATQEEIALATLLSEQSSKCLLLGLAALRLVEREQNGYRNAAVIDNLFADGRWRIFYDVVLFEAKIVYLGQSDFAESLREGRNVGLRHIPGEGRDLYHRLTENPDLQSVFYNYMGSWSKLSNPLLLSSFDFSSIRRMVDVGGGDATNSIAIAAAAPNVRITLLDLPGNGIIARKKIAACGLTDRIQVCELDMFKDEFPVGYDCFAFIHQLVIWPVESIRHLLEKAYRALPPGGRVIIFSSMSSDTEDGPLMAALDSAYFVSIPGTQGMIYPWKTYETCLRAAGFDSIVRSNCSSWTPHGLIVAMKMPKAAD